MRRQQRLVRRLLIVSGLLLSACNSPEEEQQQDGRCATGCTIQVDTVWSSNPTNEDLSLTFVPLERGDSILAVNAYDNEYIAVLGPSGETVRLVGRDGDGPGEYRSISAIAMHGDGRTYVYDRRRLTVLDSALEVASIATLPVTVERGFVLADRTSVVDGTRRVGDSTFALHLIGEDGALLNSFDGATTASAIRFIARGRDNTVWSAPRFPETPTYEIARWDPRTGRRVQSVNDRPSWLHWTPPDRSANQVACGRGDRAACDRMHDEQRPPHPPMPAIFHMWESPDSLLWVVSHVADAHWKDATISEYHGRFDSVLEARDVISGALIATRIFDQYLTGFTNSGRVMMFELDDQDQPRHMLVEVSLSKTNGSATAAGR